MTTYNAKHPYEPWAKRVNCCVNVTFFNLRATN